MKTTRSGTDAFPLVTVVTATYNLLQSGRTDYIRQSIESVHAQTYPNIEHLIIDGASTDGTLELLSEYEEKGWITIHSEPDKGIYDAFNKGVAKARGKYIAFLNSDDFWHDPRGVEYSVRELEKHNAVFSYAARLIAREGQKPSQADAPISGFFYCQPFCHQTMFTRTDSLRKLGGFNLLYKVCADGDVMIQLILKGAKPVRVPLCFTTFRAGGLNTNYPKDALEQERWSIYRANFTPLINENDSVDEELNILKQGKLSSHFRDALEKSIHPSIFRELEGRCQWDREENVWSYYCGYYSWGIIGSWPTNLAIRLMNAWVPNWNRKLVRLRHWLKRA